MRSVFITGTSRGLGGELAQELSDEKTRLTGLSRTRGDFAGNYHFCDFNDPDAAARALDLAFVSTDWQNTESAVFINNSGQLGPLDFIQNLSVDDIQENLTSNIIGASLCLSRFISATENLNLPKLFVQISSGAALPERAKPSWSLYCASKIAQEQLVRTVAKEQTYAKYPMKVVNFNPGVMETNMQRLIRDTPKESFPEVDRFIELKNQGQVADPANVAESVHNLINAFSSLENGATYQNQAFAKTT